MFVMFRFRFIGFIFLLSMAPLGCGLLFNVNRVVKPDAVILTQDDLPRVVKLDPVILTQDDLPMM